MPSSHRCRLAAACLLAAGAFWFVSCGKPSDAAHPAGQSIAKPLPVSLVAAEMLPVQRQVRILGELAPLERITVSNRVIGTISSIHFDVGDEVPPSEGDKKVPMLIIEPSRFRIAVTQARQQLNEVLAKLGRSERVGEKDTIDEQHPVLDWSKVQPEETALYKKAESERDTATKKYDRAKPLYDQKLIRDIEFTNYENDVAVARSNLRVAADEARAMVAQAQGLEATLHIRQKDLDEAVIYAPGNVAPDAERTKIKRYWVKERHVGPGEYAKEGTSLFVLEADEPIKLLARVPERELSRVAIGNKVVFNLEAYGERDFVGEIKVIEPTVDPANRTFMIEARVENPISPIANAKPERLLRSGQFVQGHINVGGKESEKVLCVPMASVASFVGENKIFAIVPSEDPAKPATVRQIPILLGQQIPVTDPDGKVQKWVEIKFKDPKIKLAAGERVVLAGADKLVDKSPVIVQEKAAATAPAGS